MEQAWRRLARNRAELLRLRELRQMLEDQISAIAFENDDLQREIQLDELARRARLAKLVLA